MMFKTILIFIIIKFVDSEMEGNVLGGEYTNINNYPHAIYLYLKSETNCICGGSILNQLIVLSAAHCFEEYKDRAKDRVTVFYGASHLDSMAKTEMRYYQVHNGYDEFTMYGDLSLLRCKTKIKFGKLVKRVAIMLEPPTEKMAYVSGWGVMNDKKDLPKNIMQTKQKLQNSRLCGRYLSLPAGTFCAGPIKGVGHPTAGDSGGALVVKKYIQIGIVSFKEVEYSLVVYTNVSYHYDWIKNNAVFIYCHKPR